MYTYIYVYVFTMNRPGPSQSKTWLYMPLTVGITAMTMIYVLSYINIRLSYAQGMQ